MKKVDLNWKEKQAYLFSLIEAKMPKHQALVHVIEEALGINEDSVYRRIRGDVILRADELHVLCSKFDISMDKILHQGTGLDISFKYSAINPAFNDSYLQYLQQLSTILMKLSVSDREFFFTAADIPFYYFPDYPELLYFKLYDRYSILTGSHISYRNFCEQLDKKLIMPLYKQTIEAYMQIDATEIWSVHTISGMLQSLKYCAGTKCFEKKETILLLLKQLSELINIIETDAGEGKRTDKKTPFHLYISPVDIANNIMLIRKGDKFNCDIRLFTAHSLFTGDEDVCLDIYKEINNLISKSMLVSSRLQQERCHFFQNMQDKISGLITEL
jgi:hypothetical protein